ncbi:conserved hypothetical protein [Aliivibrio fischeri MJ11]|uniref:Uncharacterized protein n=1 Tax=Aliivibrio fischeri (strain MJ11) TaxID=388396 RepID=B5ET78_ALIFM|nr:hypothetical protein [Aliivibrio fischeri]ACH63522.1 conserved hypothetical protein [Aliivibrio fischeri MJ11]
MKSNTKKTGDSQKEASISNGLTVEERDFLYKVFCFPFNQTSKKEDTKK